MDTVSKSGSKKYISLSPLTRWIFHFILERQGKWLLRHAFVGSQNLPGQNMGMPKYGYTTIFSQNVGKILKNPNFGTIFLPQTNRLPKFIGLDLILAWQLWKPQGHPKFHVCMPHQVLEQKFCGINCITAYTASMCIISIQLIWSLANNEIKHLLYRS